MLARVAADFYWMGRYLERVEHTARLLRYQLGGLVDTPADELALGWRVVYRALDQAVPDAPADADEAEVFLIADAYTLAGSLVEDDTNPDSMISCWQRARENARQLRPQLPLRVWTCLNQGYLWLRDCEFPTAWRVAPAQLVSEAIDRLRLLEGVVHVTMPRDDAWRFLELGRFVERFQHQNTLLRNWDRIGCAPGREPRLSWADLLRVCGAYELYCRRHTMTVRRAEVLDFMIRDPEAPRSLRFAVHRIENLLLGIDPLGNRHPLAPPHRMALRLAALVEADVGGPEPARDGATKGERPEEALFDLLARDGGTLHDLVMSAYVDYPVAEGLPT
ncbi:MAG: alpha-E domain-containing protein [Gemmatimonadota bacterium]|nr:alpha-E domain-containing protein [Gemmatimonadota bacterium]MDE2871225.1 alpha-E domain-containing protein [Gemmatimonadota bacterium]